MPLHNADVAEYFAELADLLEIKGANRFRVRSYREAAGTIGSLSRDIVEMVEAGEDLTELSGIGDGIAKKIHTIVDTGGLPQLEELYDDVPRQLRELLQVEGLGPKNTKRLYEELDITSLEQLEEAAESGKLQKLDGFGTKTEEKLLKNARRAMRGNDRTRIDRADERTQPLVEYLSALDGVEKCTVAGSFRRRKETVGDIDILVTCDDSEPVMEAFVGYDDVTEVLSRGETRSSVRIRPGLQVDLRVVQPESYGAALHYFTGSKEHNVKCRQRCIDRGLKLNEYGVFDGEDRVAGESEREVYDAMDLPFIAPELREARGETEAAEEGDLPELVQRGDLCGDLHSHTTASDGEHSIREMAEAARALGYDYLGITDHSKAVRVADGLDEEQLLEQIDHIDEVNRELEGFTVLKSCEVDILAEGDLDISDEVLEQLDYTICSIHSKFGLDEKAQTNRVISAMQNPYFDILGHPTGRLINDREAYDIDVEAVLEAAADHNSSVELNGQPARLDLHDVHCRMAKEKGLKIAISTDAHRTSHLEYIAYGVNQARRGWLESEDIINAKSVDELREFFRN